MFEYLADRQNWQTFGPFLAPALLVFFSTWAAIGVYLNRRKQAKKVAMPHTMTNDQYERLNTKRFGG